VAIQDRFVEVIAEVVVGRGPGARTVWEVASGFLVVGVVSEHGPRQGASDLTIVPITLIDTLPDHDRDAWWTFLGTSLGRLPALPEAGSGAVRAGGWPYQGLAPFGADQAALFHGRGQATARLPAMVTAQPERDGGGLIVVTGASGAGKSSSAMPRIGRLHLSLGRARS
jgi:hypothetical protein